jgi:hypothetical protein
VARSFASLSRAVIPALASNHLTTGGAPAWASAAQEELIGAMWALLSRSPTAPALDTSGEGSVGQAGMLELAEAPSAEELAQELSVLHAARQMLRAIPGLSGNARRALLGMMRAVVALPAAAALQHGDCWGEALDALCEAAGGVARATEGAAASTHEPNSSPVPAGPASATQSDAEAETAAAALPLLVECVRAALAEWAAQDDTSAIRPARAEQLSGTLARVSALRLRDRPHPPSSPTSTNAVAAARQSPFGHLVMLAPAFIDAIGRPAYTDRGPPPGREAQMLQSAIREALQLVAFTLNL